MHIDFEENYCLNPYISFRRSALVSTEIVISLGEGSERQEYATKDFALILTLLRLVGSHSRESLTSIVSLGLKIDLHQARLVVEEFFRLGMIVPKCHLSDSTLKWERWGWRDALDFHTSTRNMIWRHSYKEGVEKPPIMTYRLGRELVQPDRPKPSGKLVNQDWPCIGLPDLSASTSLVSFGEALHKRRTQRHFKGRSVDLVKVSDLLGHAVRPVVFPGIRSYRPTPTYSLGAFFSIYLLNINVESLENGVYLYSDARHALYALEQRINSNDLIHMAEDQPFMHGVAAGLLVTVHWDQYKWKYRFSRAYRLALFEISGLVQSLLITAAGLGVGTFITPAINDDYCAEMCGIDDPLQECPLYLIGLGTREDERGCTEIERHLPR